MSEIQSTIIGNVTADPEMKFTPSNIPVCSFSVAVTPRYLNTDTGAWVDGTTMFMKVTAWRDLAESTAASVRKGDRVIVVGTLRQSDWDDKDGNKRSRIEMVLAEVGLSSRWATVTVAKRARNNAPVTDDPWESEAKTTKE